MLSYEIHIAAYRRSTPDIIFDVDESMRLWTARKTHELFAAERDDERRFSLTQGRNVRNSVFRLWAPAEFIHH